MNDSAGNQGDITTVHITVCVCTFRRPDSLARLFRALEAQQTGVLFTFSIVVVDNDASQTAREVVRETQEHGRLKIDYHVEREQNIALARNRAVLNALGDYVALIDDDEIPPGDWLLSLLRAQMTYHVDGILGPVLPLYETTPPGWVVKGKFHERPSHPTGTVLDWQNTRTGNALLRRDLFTGGDQPFRSSFGMGGEDRDFFRRKIAEGRRFLWCASAPVYEAIPASRCRRWFMLRRALLRGTIPHFSATDLLVSVAAVPLYSLLLPVMFFLGHHRFMKFLIKAFDHLGRLLAFCRIKVVREKYVVE